MAKRYKFKCWNCDKTYTLQREITKEMVLYVACPYCEKEAISKLKPYRREKKKVMRAGNAEVPSNEMELQLPEILPTQEYKE